MRWKGDFDLRVWSSCLDAAREVQLAGKFVMAPRLARDGCNDEQLLAE